jgi:LPS-assembly protein
MLWYDNVIKRRRGDDDPTLQQLPVMTFSALKQPFFRNLVFCGMDSEFSNFYRQEGLTGQRLDLHPRLYLPLHYQHYFSFEPSVGFRQTAWYVDRPDDLPDPTREEYEYLHRELYDIQVDLSTDLFSVYPVDCGTVRKIKHTVIPRMEYTYVPDLNQSQYAGFDDVDEIAPENRLTFSLTNLLISRNRAPQTGQASASPPPDTYNQFLWFKIEQSYDFLKENTPDEKPFLPLYAELILTPVRLLTLHADTEWDHDSGNFLTANTHLKLNTPRKDHFTLEYRYTRDASKSIYLDFSVAVTDRYRIFGKYEKNLEDAEDIESGLGYRYQAQCWGYELFYEKEDHDRKFGFMVSLTGLGDLGNGL